MKENIKLAKQLIVIAKDLIGDNLHKEISNQFKSLSREINKPNNHKNISKGLNNLSKSFNKMPKASDEIDVVAELKSIANELLEQGE